MSMYEWPKVTQGANVAENSDLTPQLKSSALVPYIASLRPFASEISTPCGVHTVPSDLRDIALVPHAGWGGWERQFRTSGGHQGGED